MGKNCILAKSLWGFIIEFYDVIYENNTEEIYEITSLNILPLLWIEQYITVCILDNNIQCWLSKYWPPGFYGWLHCSFEAWSPILVVVTSSPHCYMVLCGQKWSSNDGWVPTPSKLVFLDKPIPTPRFFSGTSSSF